jgi:hypothetical protein
MRGNTLKQFVIMRVKSQLNLVTDFARSLYVQVLNTFAGVSLASGMLESTASKNLCCPCRFFLLLCLEVMSSKPIFLCCC